MRTKLPVWGAALVLAVLLLSCVVASVAEEDVAEVDVADEQVDVEDPRVFSSRRLLRTYIFGCAAQVKWKYPRGCEHFLSCYDGSKCSVASDCCSYQCQQGRCCGSWGGKKCAKSDSGAKKGKKDMELDPCTCRLWVGAGRL